MIRSLTSDPLLRLLIFAFDVAMATSNNHSRLINSAAKTTLRPLGFQQKGRSRVWFADRGYWALIVEFQPSGFGKGSYLNIAASWLWSPYEWRFDYMHRAGQFIRFESEDQFQTEVEGLAKLAASEAKNLDEKFGSLNKIAAHLNDEARDSRKRLNPWTLYHAAIVHGLIGDRKFSAAAFADLLAQKAANDWHRAIQSESGTLMRQLEDQTVFDAAIRAKVARTRSALKLLPLSDS